MEADAFTALMWLSAPVLVSKMIRILSKHMISPLLPAMFEKLVDGGEIPFANKFLERYFPGRALELIYESFAPDPDPASESCASSCLATYCAKQSLKDSPIHVWISFLDASDDSFDCFFQAHPMPYATYRQFCLLRCDLGEIRPSYSMLDDWSRDLVFRQTALQSHKLPAADLALAEADLKDDLRWFMGYYELHGCKAVADFQSRVLSVQAGLNYESKPTIAEPDGSPAFLLR